MPYFYRQLDETVRGRVETIFATHYNGLKVTVHSAALAHGGIEVRGVSIVDPQADGPRPELAYLEELFLVCETDLQTLVQGTPKIVEIIARRPVIRVTHRPDGTWSASRLFPLPRFGNQSPVITVESATLELFDPLKHPTSSLTVRDACLKVTRPTDQPASPAQSVPYVVTGYCAADSIRRIEFAGTFDPAGGGWDFHGAINGLEVAPELIHNLPGATAGRLDVLGSLRGQVNSGKFSFRYTAGAEPPWDYEVSGQLSRGRLDDSRLPHPLTDLRAAFRANAKGVAIHGLTANMGPATLRLDMERNGYGDNAPLVLAAKANQLRLDSELGQILPAKWQEAWRQLQPAGDIDLDAQVRFDGATWTPDVSVTCRDVAFTYHKFPYRLEHGSGPVTVRNNALHLDVTAYSDVDPVRLTGDIERLGADWTGRVSVDAKKLRVDEKLTRALPQRPREIVKSLDAHGTIDLSVQYWRDAGAPMHNRMTIDLNGCDIRYQGFPYPLYQVHGTVESNDGLWTLHDLKATNDAGVVKCHGEMVPSPDGEHVLTLAFDAFNVSLEDELRNALRPAGQALWDEIRPTGAVDLHVDVRQQSNSREPWMHVTAWPASDRVVEERTTARQGTNSSARPMAVSAVRVAEQMAIFPRYFPYRLEKLGGRFDYENGHVTIAGLRAEHGPNTRLSAQGHCEVEAAGGWRLHLENVQWGRLSTDRDLMQALPPHLKKAITDMRLSGPVSIRGVIDLASSGKPNDPLRAAWNVECDLQQVGMAYNLPLENINGRLGLSGDFDGRKFRSRGELNLDSLTYKDIQFTEIRGPVWIDDARVLLGATVPAAAGERPRTITAHCCGGLMQTDGWVTLGAGGQYNFDAIVSQAQLGRAAQELLAGRQKLTGDLSAQLNIHGAGSGAAQLVGSGHVELRNADIYQLPLMVSMLSFLSMKVPNGHAFSSSDVDFRLDGGHVYFDRINFHGDAISLRGTGEMGFDKNLQMTFYTVVGQDRWTVPVISEVLGGASQQLMAIYVEGTCTNPQISKKALPAVDEALKEIQTELQSMRAAPAANAALNRPAPAARPALERR